MEEVQTSSAVPAGEGEQENAVEEVMVVGQDGEEMGDKGNDSNQPVISVESILIT